MPVRRLPSNSAAPHQYSDKECSEALNNAVVAFTRWKGLRGMELKGPLLKTYCEAFLDDAVASVTVFRRDSDGKPLEVPKRLLNDKELALCLLLSTTLLVFRQIFPEDSDLQDTFVGRFLAGKGNS